MVKKNIVPHENFVINGCNPITRSELMDAAELAMLKIENMQTIFDAIVRLSKEDKTISDLAELGATIAAFLDNDIDLIREAAQKAGLIGELMKQAA